MIDSQQRDTFFHYLEAFGVAQVNLESWPLNPQPSIFNPQSSIVNPQPSTPNHQPPTRDPKFKTKHRAPGATGSATPQPSAPSTLTPPPRPNIREREIFIDSLLVRVHLIIKMN